MRQTLFRIWLSQPWSFLSSDADGLPRLGACWVLVIAFALALIVGAIRERRWPLRDPVAALSWGVVLLALSLQPNFGLLPEWAPVFGYGVMVLIGFSAALGFSYWRAKAIGFNPDLVMDSAFWLLVTGVAGGRIAYLLQYGREMLAGKNLPQALFALINLAEGGLVLIGALVGGGLGFLAFCKRRNVSVGHYADLLIPGIFLGIAFGRIGCLLNGCCYGDRCDLPWAITFPPGSVTFSILVERGFLDPNAPATFPLHPTQIYSSLDGFIWAFVTGVYFWYRRYPGDNFALGCILYSASRILIEFLRADEMGQLGTGLTISQLYSLGIMAMGIVIIASGPYRARRTQQRMLTNSVAG